MTTVDSRHKDSWALLPWYANGSLEGAEREAVRAHLADCEACRDELAHCRDLAVAVQTAPAPAWAPSSEHLARLLERIDALEAGAGKRGWRQSVHEWVSHLRDTLRGAPLFMRWALAAQAAVVVLLAVTVIWQATAGWAPAYRTLASPGEPRRGHGQIRVVLADDTTQAEMRSLLGRVKGSIVGGPSPAGAYTVEVAGAAGDVAAAVEALRASAKVVLAVAVVSR
jgi:anti-sigma factor RsiW